jgi:release factor glutamine methyltransferase
MHRADALLRAARRRLTENGIKSATLDARLLLQAASDLRHEQLIADPDHPLTDEIVQTFNVFVERRSTGEPVSRIIGQREFWSLLLNVTPDVLDPRPETEHLVREALPFLSAGNRFLDLGTGSGAITIALAVERQDITGVAVDQSEAALEVARGNAEANGVSHHVSFLHSNWFSNVTGRFHLIVSNPPYIRATDIGALDRDVRDFDPHLALNGGPDGLACYRAIAAKAAAFLQPGGHIIVEIGHDQANDVEEIFGAHGFQTVKRYSDHAGLARGLVFTISQ